MAGLSFFQPNPGPEGPCPICGRPRPHSERYPDAVCAECVERATDDAGRRLIFSNLFPESLGGFQALYADTRERIPTPDDECECLIDGVRCVAREAYLGGIVVRREAD
jgi:hypothetical protein